MNDEDFMNQPSGVFCGDWELTNACLLFWNNWDNNKNNSNEKISVEKEENNGGDNGNS